MRRWDAGTLRLLLPVLSYYICFIAVVRYQYDRFFLGICIVLALFGGRFLAERCTRDSRRWVSVAACLLVIYWTAHGTAVNAAMISDSRHRTEAWIQERVSRSDIVVMAGHRQDLPRLEDYRTVWTLDDWSLIERLNPNYVVVDGGRHCGRDNGRLHTIFLSRQNYRLVFQGSRSEFLLGRLATDVYHSPCHSGFSNLSRINPPTEVYERMENSASRPD